jgi:hypothetical protein
MSKEERASIIAIIINLMINTYIVVQLVQLFGSGSLSGEDATMVWARAVVWAIPAAIVLTIAFNILLMLTGKQRSLDNVVDERDRIFQLRGMGVTLVVAALGYIGMLVTLSIGWPAVAGLTLLYICFAAGDLLGNIVRLASYRIGC